MDALLETDLPLPRFRRGKVRDVYDLGDRLLIVATDRVSAFDCVMPDPIPGKGRILTQVANFWFDATRDLCPNHLLATDVDAFPASLRAHGEVLAGRSILVAKTRPLPIECVVRGYLAGSGLAEYQASGTVCGLPLPPGLGMAHRLPEPLFTPSTKEETGHDRNIAFEEVAGLLGPALAGQVRDLSLALYRRGSDLAHEKGILLADTKFEFGLLPGGDLILIDEVLTPDSSRYWPADRWEPGRNPPSLDKQFLRDHLAALPDWDRTPPAPHLPPEVVEGIRQRYQDLATRFGIRA